MKTNTKVLASLALGIGGLIASQYAAATSLQFPGVSPMATGEYNDFTVYSFDLLNQCADSSTTYPSGDPRCTDYQNFEGSQPLAPPAENIGAIKDELIIYTGENTPNAENFTAGPFPDDSQGDGPGEYAVDNNFEAVTGSDGSWEMTADGEPGDAGTKGGTGSDDEFLGDLAGRFDARVSDVVEYLTHTDAAGVETMSDLVFLFGNNAQGESEDQWMYIWAQVRILDFNEVDPTAAPDLVACFELSTFAENSGCFDTGVDPEPLYNPLNPFNLVDVTDPTLGYKTQPTNPPGNNNEWNEYVPIIGDFCVDKDSGESYNIGQAGNAGECALDVATGDARDGYYISNNLGNKNAEFAAYIEELNDMLLTYATAGYYMSINIKTRNLTDGDETAWICNNCYLDRPPTYLPGPAPLALIGLGLLGIHLARKKATRSA